MGPYCMYCDRRCFVLRVANGKHLLMATCSKGMAHVTAYINDNETVYDPTSIVANAIDYALAHSGRGSRRETAVDPAEYGIGSIHDWTVAETGDRA